MARPEDAKYHTVLHNTTNRDVFHLYSLYPESLGRCYAAALLDDFQVQNEF